MLTIQKHRKLEFVDVHDILQVIDHLIRSIPQFRILDNSFECGSLYGQLHLHAVISAGYFKFLEFKALQGFKLTWKTVTNLQGALNYIYKDTNKKDHIQQDIISCNRYCHPFAPNLFIN